MKILAVADTEEKRLWDFYKRERTAGVELILSCGDVQAEYLEFLVTMVGCPLLYVKGNHDERYADAPPEGCVDIDGKVYEHNGIRILGLGGSMRYREGSFQYTDAQMKKRIRRVTPKLMWKKGFDILVTHAPPYGCGDLSDRAHQGFSCFNDLLERWRPAYLLHGHTHQNYTANFQRYRQHASGTNVVNCCGSVMLEIETAERHP